MSTAMRSFATWGVLPRGRDLCDRLRLKPESQTKVCSFRHFQNEYAGGYSRVHGSRGRQLSNLLAFSSAFALAWQVIDFPHAHDVTCDWLLPYGLLYGLWGFYGFMCFIWPSAWLCP